MQVVSPILAPKTKRGTKTLYPYLWSEDQAPIAPLYTPKLPSINFLRQSRFQRRSSSSSSKTTQLSSRKKSKTFCPNPETPLALENADRRKSPESQTNSLERYLGPRIIEEMMMLARLLIRNTYSKALWESLRKYSVFSFLCICAPFLPERLSLFDLMSPSNIVIPARFCWWFFFPYTAQFIFKGFMQKEKYVYSSRNHVLAELKKNKANEFHNLRDSRWPIFWTHWRSLMLPICKAAKIRQCPWSM